MENKTHNKLRIATAILAILMLSSTLMMLGNSIVIKESIEAPPLSPTQDYGDIMQYDWPMGGRDEGQTGFNPGPGPEKPDVLWKVQTSGSGFISVFNGKAFVLSGSTLKALNAFTGELIWNTTLLRSASGSGGTTKIDDTYLFVDCAGPEVHRIDNGEFVANYTIPYYSGHPGSAQYFPGTYSSTLKMKYALSFDRDLKVGLVNAVSLEDPTNPTLAWTYTVEKVSEIQGCGDGRVYVGTTADTLYALDGETGDFLWEGRKQGVVQQHGMYYDGNFYQAAASQCMTCWNATNGEVQWEFDSNSIGERGYFAYRGAAGYGRVYDASVSNYPNGWVLCWDAKTGELLWKQPGYYNINYATYALAGGKLYGITCDRAAGMTTAGLEMPGYSFTCFDAFTGDQLWSIPNLQFATPTVAYGNVYGAYGGYVYCIGDTTPAASTAKPWSFGYTANLDQTRVAVGQSGPANLSFPKWVYSTGGKISGSPAIVDGKVYIGSDDQNWYCIDAYSGKKIWNFEVGYDIGSSAAVVAGRVYTGADDGNIYCLNANTGQQIWMTPAGGLFKHILMPQELQSRSSPIVVGNRVYVGALDGKVYSLDTADGEVQWTYTTDGPIGGSPVYSNGAIYITSTDRSLYCISTSGALLWKSIPLNIDVGVNPTYTYFCTGTPVVADGVAYVPGGVTYGVLTPTEKYRWLRDGVGPAYTNPGGANGGGMRMAAFNASTGESIWNQTIAGNSGGVWTPTYFNGMLYIPEYMRLSAMNANNPDSGPAAPTGYQGQPAGNRTWTQWVGYQILSSAAYADDIRGAKVYISSDVGSVTAMAAADGEPLSAFQSGANIEGSPSIWEGKMYVGGSDGNLYCFDDSPTVGFDIHAESSKGAEMWNNETVTIKGRLTANPMEMTWNDGAFIPIASDMHPGLPNAPVEISFTKPDGSNLPITATTDNSGYFTVTYSPSEVGDWGWVAYYAGRRTVGITYNEAYTDYKTLSVISPSTTPSVTSTPSATTPAASTEPTSTANDAFGGMPTEYLYAAVAVVVIVVIVVAAYVYNKQRKK